MIIDRVASLLKMGGGNLITSSKDWHIIFESIPKLLRYRKIFKDSLTFQDLIKKMLYKLLKLCLKVLNLLKKQID